MAAIIEVEGLTKSYGGKRGIADVTFQIDEGDVFGFLGPNGAGKTTTIRVLMALLRADSGTARIAGLDVWEKSLDIKRLIGYVPGEPSLDPNLTGGQILEYFANLRGGVDRAYLKKLIERMDLDTSRKFRQYSTGNKRKVVLVQAFMHRPRLLILDEPTSGLDPLNQQEFDGMVKEASGLAVWLFVRRDVGAVVAGPSFIHLPERRSVPADLFNSLEGVEKVEQLNQGHAVRLTVQGPADAVIKAAARYPVVALTSYEPSLEDIFLRYYEREEEAAGVV